MKLLRAIFLRGGGTPWWVVSLLLGPSECWAGIGAPSFPLAGAYFPAWLICLFIGGIGAALFRTLFLVLHIDSLLRFHLVTYLSLGTLLGLAGWLILFGQ
ncbi:YtcA family lipoprotein [Bombella sp. TMW 2.2543]|uniref:Uncharacterized protein YtcA n=1 Tax=Bombella pluederhausensis TaxID=2967336 RepID=A0ABT3WI99_9PROT|nr:YtcA family lipoprotein [Bombella pluederhausensis]MCX5617353.1 YtcA family lipoprotein [Bombella pluederhausensis]